MDLIVVHGIPSFNLKEKVYRDMFTRIAAVPVNVNP
jgi:hypothetical protein